MFHQNKISSALIKTLIYSSIFHFPLTIDELWRYLITDKKISRREFDEFLKEENTVIQKKGRYYFLTGEESSVANRLEEEKYLITKFSLAKRAAHILSYIPSILFIGISGSLAAGSSSNDSDIDFFIITSAKTVWISRFLAITFLTFFNMRRKRGVAKAPNKICLNIFVGFSKIQYFSQSQEIYTARELAQLYPLWNCRETYEQLLKTNRWYLEFLPNAHNYENLSTQRGVSPVTLKILCLLNPLFMYFQLNYMKKHRTKEVIEQELILLHPHDYKDEILQKYQTKMMEYDSLTKL